MRYILSSVQRNVLYPKQLVQRNVSYPEQLVQRNVLEQLMCYILSS